MLYGVNLFMINTQKNIKIDTDKLKQDILKNENQTEYLLSEIVFDLKDNQTLDEKFNIIKKWN